MIRKWDGHTHTEYCPHGSITDMEVLIQKAIKRGFTHYSVTEHAPLPSEFKKKCSGPLYPIETGGIAENDFEHYLNKVKKLQKKYSSEIKIYTGVELDYLIGFEDWTRDFLREYGPYLEDNILSVHFLNGTGGVRAIDYTSADFHEGLLSYYGDFQVVQSEYLRVVHESLMVDLGKFKPRRIGHISLVRKFLQAFPYEIKTFSDADHLKYKKIFLEMERQKLMLDFNMAGLFKEDCREPYPPISVLKKHRPKIELIYGSDSHDLNDIGRGYSTYNNYF